MLIQSYRGFSLLEFNSDFVVVNKAPGIGMHDEEGEPGLVSLAREQLGVMLYPVHRLDKVTSGVLLLARTPAANSELSQNFARREVRKCYLALSDGKPSKKQGWVKGDMERGRRGSWKLTRHMENPAITWFCSESVLPGLRLFKVVPQTGKTHQIRVALKSIGAAILGDPLYGASRADRVYLHSAYLSFVFQQQTWSFSAKPHEGEFFLLPAMQTKIAESISFYEQSQSQTV